MARVVRTPLVDPRTSTIVATGLGGIALFTATSLAFSLSVAAASCFGLVALVACNLSPKLSLVVFLTTVCFVPVWWGAEVGGYQPAAALVALAVLPGALVRGLQVRNHAIAIVLLVAAFVALLVVSGASMAGHGFILVAQWVPAFFVGYALTQQAGPKFVRDTITVIFTAVAVFAIIEYFARWNPYFGTAPASRQYLTIGALQVRGGVTRSEWSFGHAIALANSLALAIPMVLTSRFAVWVKSLAVVLIIIAIITTFSRSGLLSAALVFVFMFCARRGEVSRRVRVTVAGVMIATAALTLPWVESVFSAASTEVARSAQGRLRLLDLIPYLKPFGTATGYHEFDGVFRWFGVVTIDNAFLRLAINFGWVFGGLCLIGAMWIFLRAIAGRASAPEIALASVVPALLTVALITQLGILVWFYMGVAAVMARGSSAADPRINPAKSTIPVAFEARKGILTKRAQGVIGEPLRDLPA